MSSSRASSWEQSRRKPWSMLSSHGKHLEKKGRDNSENLTSAHGTAQQVGAPLSSQTPSISSNEKLGQEQVNKEQFEYMDLFRQMAFGGTVGAFTGVMFGFMDGMREAQSSKLLKNASNSAKARFLVQGSSRAGLIFGSFFSGLPRVLRVSLTELTALSKFGWVKFSERNVVVDLTLLLRARIYQKQTRNEIYEPRKQFRKVELFRVYCSS